MCKSRRDPKFLNEIPNSINFNHFIQILGSYPYASCGSFPRLLVDLIKCSLRRSIRKGENILIKHIMRRRETENEELTPQSLARETSQDFGLAPLGLVSIFLLLLLLLLNLLICLFSELSSFEGIITSCYVLGDRSDIAT